MKKLISAVLLGTFVLSFVAGIAVTNAKADDPYPICFKVYCKYDARTGEYYWWCCGSAEEKGNSGKIVYKDCRFAYELGPCG